MMGKGPKGFFLGCCFAALLVIAPAFAEDPFKPVLHSPHELAPVPVAEKSACAFCHTEQIQQSPGPAPVWNRAAAPFSLSGEHSRSPDYDNQPTGSSTDCLACHDGAIGTDVHGIGERFQGRQGAAGRLDHPISIAYPRRPDGLFVPPDPSQTYSRYWSIPDKSGKLILLPTGPTSPYYPKPEGPSVAYDTSVTFVRTVQGKVQCDSCHTPHNPEVRPFLRASPQSLCLICHNR
jgi:predicted CXXCH cytochrome family protein